MLKKEKNNLSLGDLYRELEKNEGIIIPNVMYLLELATLMPLSNSCVERIFSRLTWVKTKLRNSLGDENLDRILRILVESPDKINDADLEIMITNFKSLSEQSASSRQMRMSL